MAEIKENANLIEINKLKFKKIYEKHVQSRTGMMSFVELTKFVKNSKIFPDLISLFELKKIAQKIMRNVGQIKFNQFLLIMKDIAKLSFTSQINVEEKIKMLLIHIRNPCKLNYQTNLNFSQLLFVQKSAKELKDIAQQAKPSIVCKRTVGEKLSESYSVVNESHDEYHISNQKQDISVLELKEFTEKRLYVNRRECKTQPPTTKNSQLNQNFGNFSFSQLNTQIEGNNKPHQNEVFSKSANMNKINYSNNNTKLLPNTKNQTTYADIHQRRSATSFISPKFRQTNKIQNNTKSLVFQESDIARQKDQIKQLTQKLRESLSKTQRKLEKNKLQANQNAATNVQMMKRVKKQSMTQSQTENSKSFFSQRSPSNLRQYQISPQPQITLDLEDLSTNAPFIPQKQEQFKDKVEQLFEKFKIRQSQIDSYKASKSFEKEKRVATMAQQLKATWFTPVIFQCRSLQKESFLTHGKRVPSKIGFPKISSNATDYLINHMSVIYYLSYIFMHLILYKTEIDIYFQYSSDRTTLKSYKREIQL